MNKLTVLKYAILVCLFSQATGWGKGAKTVHVRSYTKKDGTHVRAHSRSAPSQRAFSGFASTYSNPSLFQHDSSAERLAETSDVDFERWLSTIQTLPTSRAFIETERVQEQDYHSELIYEALERKIKSGSSSEEAIRILNEFASVKVGTSGATRAALRVKELKSVEDRFERVLKSAATWKHHQDITALRMELQEVCDAIPPSRYRDTAIQILEAIDLSESEAQAEFERIKSIEKFIPVEELRAEVSAFLKRFTASSFAKDIRVILQTREDRELEADGKLTLAKSLLRLSKKIAANTRLDDIVDRYPETSAAKQAKRFKVQ